MCFSVKLRLQTRYSNGMNVAAGQKTTVALVAIAVLAVLSAVRDDESGDPRPTHEASKPVEENGKPRPVHVMSELVKKAFPYEPAAVQKKEETKEKEPDAQVVTMEHFTVTESRRSRQLEEKIESDNEKMKAEKFSLVRGGTIWKKGRVEVGAWSAQGGINFLKYLW
jgi:hypothetical protein